MTTCWMILFYGRPYLKYSLASIYDQCDRIVILYSPKPSQGHGTPLSVPDTEDELKKEAEPFMDKIVWIKGDWNNEGEHTNAIWEHVEDCEWSYRVDYDEIVPAGFIQEMIRQAEQTENKFFQVPFVHLWKSFNKCCLDSQTPYRLTRLKRGEGDKILDSHDGKWRVVHCGYAIPDEYMRFKWSTHGHKPELRPDWFEHVWHGDAEENLHPVANNLWPCAQPFNKYSLPPVLRLHPFFNFDTIH